MILMGNSDSYEVQEVIKNWEQTHEIPKNKKSGVIYVSPAFEQRPPEEVRQDLQEMGSRTD